jgi:hypothetical protein
MPAGTGFALSQVTEGRRAMQVIAIGKWSKTLKRFRTVVSMRRPVQDPPARRTTQSKNARKSNPELR